MPHLCNFEPVVATQAPQKETSEAFEALGANLIEIRFVRAYITPALQYFSGVSIMKILFALAVVCSPAAFADIDDPSDVGPPDVRYLSWCEDGRVMEEGARGFPQVKFDCARDGLVCKSEERIIGGGRVSFATCQKR
jgi:hypothetical protein